MVIAKKPRVMSRKPSQRERIAKVSEFSRREEHAKMHEKAPRDSGKAEEETKDATFEEKCAAVEKLYFTDPKQVLQLINALEDLNLGTMESLEMYEEQLEGARGREEIRRRRVESRVEERREALDGVRSHLRKAKHDTDQKTEVYERTRARNVHEQELLLAARPIHKWYSIISGQMQGYEESDAEQGHSRQTFSDDASDDIVMYVQGRDAVDELAKIEVMHDKISSQMDSVPEEFTIARLKERTRERRDHQRDLKKQEEEDITRKKQELQAARMKSRSRILAMKRKKPKMVRVVLKKKPAATPLSQPMSFDSSSKPRSRSGSRESTSKVSSPYDTTRSVGTPRSTSDFGDEVKPELTRDLSVDLDILLQDQSIREFFE
eukprot:TRINITY_DN1859_c0_g2_i3.p1 TRINITY_DN1859_c0_g2~~TRINITY_DN1859_c0_g2_i3.p1  ORF type:complete len:378 (-),score=144.96 TRINITY_DN1859_c0_g2_i3:1442-2575(-)